MTTTQNEVATLTIGMAPLGYTTSSGRYLNNLVKEWVSNFHKMSRLAPTPNRQRGYTKPKPWPSK